MADAARPITQEDLPAKLLEIPEPPEQLYVRGNLVKEGNKTLAVVGSRALSRYGAEACAKLIEGLAGYPVTIISGLALGADAASHRAALSAGLHTIAVLGSGVSDAAISPRSNLGLAKDILASGGALVSENPPDYAPYPHDFPKRNRIVVGLADAVLIVEAGERSGTLITARLSSEYNRDLLCIPHRIGDPHGVGANLFLRLGATLVAEPAHILESLHLPLKKADERILHHLEGSEKILYDLLAEPLPRDELIRASNLPINDALTALVMLELRGILKEEYGAWRRA